MRKSYCITNSLGQFMDEDGLWHDDLKVYCCFSYDYARELQEIYDVYNSTEIKEI
jgi:hypothetical protein